MDGTGKRLKAFREMAGVEVGLLADAIGISATWLEELETGEVELEESLDLEQIRELALHVKVGLAELLTGSPLPPDVKPITFKDLARHLRRRLETEPSLESLEEKTGWALGDFLKRPDMEGWGQRTGFFHAVCGTLGLDWLGIVAYAESMISEP